MTTKQTTKKSTSKSAAPKLKVKQIGSAIGRKYDQKQALVALGLNRINRERELPDTPATWGLINVVKHLVTVTVHEKKASKKGEE